MSWPSCQSPGNVPAYCFRLRQQHVPKHETYDVLDERRLTAFLCRVARRLLDVVENELL